MTTIGVAGNKIETEVYAAGEIIATQCVSCGANGQDLVKVHRRDAHRTLDLSLGAIYMMDPLGVRAQPVSQEQIKGGQGQQPPPINPGSYHAAATADVFGTPNNALKCRLDGTPVPCERFFRAAGNGAVSQVAVSTTGGMGGVGGNRGIVMGVLINLASQVNGERRLNPDYDPDFPELAPKYLSASLDAFFLPDREQDSQQLSPCLREVLRQFFPQQTIQGKSYSPVDDARFKAGIPWLYKNTTDPVAITIGLYDIYYDSDCVGINGGTAFSLTTIIEDVAHAEQFLNLWKSIEHSIRDGKYLMHYANYEDAKFDWKIYYAWEAAKSGFSYNNLVERETKKKVVDIMNRLVIADAAINGGKICGFNLYPWDSEKFLPGQ